MNEERLRQIIRQIISEAAIDATEPSDFSSAVKGKISSAIKKVAPDVNVNFQRKRGGGLYHVRTQPSSSGASPLSPEQLFAALESEGFVAAGDDGFKSTSVLASGSTPTYAFKDPSTDTRYFIVIGGGAKTTKEELQTQALQKTLSDLGEVMLVPDPNSQFEDLRRPRKILGVENVKGTPKADIFLRSDNEADNVYLSLKDGSTVKQFQQYGGMTNLADRPEVLTFFKDVISSSEVVAPNKIQLPAPSFFRQLPPDSELALLGVYGPDAYPISGEGFGLNKVHMLLQAPVPTVEPLPEQEAAGIKDQFGIGADTPVYKLVGAHVVTYPNIPSEEYAPVMHARPDNSTKLSVGKFMSDAERKEMGLASSISGVRFLIFPKGKLPSTTQDLDTYMSSLPEVVLVREFIKEALLTEAFTKTDERAIGVMARKEIDAKWKDHEKKIQKMFDDRDKTLFRNDAFYKVIARIYQELQRAYAEDQFKYATRYTRKDIPLARFRPS